VKSNPANPVLKMILCLFLYRLTGRLPRRDSRAKATLARGFFGQCDDQCITAIIRRIGQQGRFNTQLAQRLMEPIGTPPRPSYNATGYQMEDLHGIVTNPIR